MYGDTVPDAWTAPPPVCDLDPLELHIWRASLAPGEHAIGELAAELSPDEAERAGRFVFQRDRDRFVAARGLLRRVLAAYLGAAPAELRFAYTRYGKPSLAGPQAWQQLCFNLSHSSELAVIGVAWRRQLGVDLERIREELDYQMLLPNVFSPREQRALLALPEAQRRRAFFQSWVCKEAYLKARGLGLSYPPDSVEVGPLPDAPARLTLPPEEDAGRWRLRSLDAGSGYTAAVVSDGEPAALRLFDAVES